MRKQFKIALSILTIVTVLIGGGFLTATSANASVPGDLLYSIDRAYEKVQRIFKLSPEVKAEFEVDLLEEREQELSILEENDSDLDIIEEAVEDLDEQEENVKTRLREAEDNENSDSGELVRIRERLELQQKENLKLMEKLQNKYQIQDGESDQGDGQQSDSIDDEQGQSDEDQGNGSGSKTLDDKVIDYKQRLDKEVGSDSSPGSNNSNNTNENQQDSGNNPN
ncbi:DUF5667 domain-containing protein [Patescibacteria group bacterium]